MMMTMMIDGQDGWGDAQSFGPWRDYPIGNIFGGTCSRNNLSTSFFVVAHFSASKAFQNFSRTSKLFSITFTSK